MITLNEVEVLLEDHGCTEDENDPGSCVREDGESCSWGFWLYGTGESEFTKINDEFMARPVVQSGGFEGGGEKVRLIIEFTPHVGGVQKFSMESRFFEKLGYYGSYYGVDWDGTFSEVFPQERTVTVYEKS